MKLEESEKLLIELFFAARTGQKMLLEVASSLNLNAYNSDEYSELEKICDKIIDTFCSRCTASYMGSTEVASCWACKYEPRIKL